MSWCLFIGFARPAKNNGKCGSERPRIDLTVMPPYGMDQSSTSGPPSNTTRATATTAAPTAALLNASLSNETLSNVAVELANLTANLTGNVTGNWSGDLAATGVGCAWDHRSGRNCSWLDARFPGNESSLDASRLPVEDQQPAEKVYWALMLVILPFLAVFGNILIILSVYKERSLQTATNYFIVSLAFADLLVAAAVMPFAVYVLVSPTSSLLLRGARRTKDSTPAQC